MVRVKSVEFEPGPGKPSRRAVPWALLPASSNGRTEDFDSSYESSNLSAGTSTYEIRPESSGGLSGGSGLADGDAVDRALEAEVDRAREMRRWEAVATLATELATRGAERRERAGREAQGVIEFRSRRCR